MLRINELLTWEEGKTLLSGKNSEQMNFRVASELFAKHGKLIDMNKLPNIRTLHKHQEIT
jgi:hypothetical protein